MELVKVLIYVFCSMGWGTEPVYDLELKSNYKLDRIEYVVKDSLRIKYENYFPNKVVYFWNQPEQTIGILTTIHDKEEN